MRKVMLLLVTIAATVLLTSGIALTQAPQGGPSRYIVVFDNSVSEPEQAANAMARRYGLGVGFLYSHALKGFSAVIPNERVAAVRTDERVDYVEPDKTMYAAAQTLPWGIDKIEADLSSTKAGDGWGTVSNVNAYVLDSGIYKRHTDLYVVQHVNFTGDGMNRDCNGHGTHVAGSVAAKDNTSAVVGAAPGAPLTGVKVLGCNSSGSLSGIIKGVDWVTANAKKPAIANMSLSGPTSQTLDDAIKNSSASGVFYSVAAGNAGANACNYSPARVGAGTNNGVATVAATNKSDGETSASNYGPCVDIWAPGANILSTKMGGGTATMSGTSMAAAHVSGGGALYLSSHTSDSPSTVESTLKSSATTTVNKSKDGTTTITREYVGDFTVF